MSLKLFGQLIAIGGQVVGKIISSAYKQAVSNAVKNPNVKKSASSASSPSSIGLDEAAKILNCPPTSPRDEVIKKYEHLFKMNDRTNGGSFYLQSKVVRAREAFEEQLAKTTTNNNNAKPKDADSR